jgi:hypothetical protein
MTSALDHPWQRENIKQEDVQEFLQLASVFPVWFCRFVNALVSIKPYFMRPSSQFTGQNVLLFQVLDALGKAPRQFSELFLKGDLKRPPEHHACAVHVATLEVLCGSQIEALNIRRQAVWRLEWGALWEMVDCVKQALDFSLVRTWGTPSFFGKACDRNPRKTAWTLEKHPVNEVFWANFRFITMPKKERCVFGGTVGTINDNDSRHG